MYTFAVTLFFLILPKIVMKTVLDCSDCFYEAKCFCTGEHTRNNPRMDACAEISCLNKDLKTMRSFCKDTDGQCLSSDEFAFGTYNFRCVKLYCKVTEGSVTYDQVCRVDHNFADDDYMVYKDRIEC
ncbi:Hypothetical predicted protein [Octopus vulgaris]|uniref:Uncharacterized protein n=1 Tax=Octopus vulgaris TaxID=6645 RepID=A0AA36AYH6_OCTVU|nr:Hypothetical predicted protein [Octopus vulgaris]